MKIFCTVVVSILLFFSAYSQKWDSLRRGLGNASRVMYADTLDNYLYVAGGFYTVDGKHMKGIARWNGIQWDSLGAGIDGLDTANKVPQNTLAITRYNGDLYV